MLRRKLATEKGRICLCRVYLFVKFEFTLAVIIPENVISTRAKLYPNVLPEVTPYEDETEINISTTAFVNTKENKEFLEDLTAYLSFIVTVVSDMASRKKTLV
jgi:hypothetical protein